MQHSEQVPKFKQVQEQLKSLLTQRNQIIQDMIPDVRRAILAKMDWEQITFSNIDWDFLGSCIKADVSNPKEDYQHRYVFTVELLKEDTFKVTLDFREEFK